ncbi:glycosyltransferase [Altererythrobacter indicus]|uniref:Glycosyltransferase n=1 Tax=Altericroceibacterium indicum TaxID=374177 RepID=A0A845ABK2_9SPHN|nr:glycosyltransferase [Altericroceibacterium indicum]
MGSTKPDISVIILTHNEQAHIARAIASVQAIAEAIFIVDSGSDDNTLAIARSMGVHVVSHPFTTQARQLNWALDTLPIRSHWILRLDADEIIEDDLAQAIIETLPALGEDITGVEFARKHIFMGRWIRHGGRYPLWMLRLFRKGYGRSEDRWMDEHIALTKGQTMRLQGGFADINLGDLSHFTTKHNGYATREAISILINRYALVANAIPTDEPLAIAGSAVTRRWCKRHIYDRLPFGCGPMAYFLYRFIVRAGFLDGVEGVIYHGLQGFWYRFLVDAKVLYWDRALRKLPDREARLARLEELTGYRLQEI